MALPEGPLDVDVLDVSPEGLKRKEPTNAVTPLAWKKTKAQKKEQQLEIWWFLFVCRKEVLFRLQTQKMLTDIYPFAIDC